MSPRRGIRPHRHVPAPDRYGFSGTSEAPGGFISATGRISKDEFDANPMTAEVLIERGSSWIRGVRQREVVMERRESFWINKSQARHFPPGPPS